jgi:hypothetical protein
MVAGDHPEAGRLYLESEAMFRAAGDCWGMARSCTDRGHFAMVRGDLAEAGVQFVDALRLFQQLRHRRGIAILLEGCAQLMALQDRPTPALVIAAAARHLRDTIAVPGRSAQQARLEAALSPIRDALPPGVVQACCEEGAAMPLAAAISYALEAMRPVSP